MKTNKGAGVRAFLAQMQHIVLTWALSISVPTAVLHRLCDAA
jgi:hypothetical protein